MRTAFTDLVGVRHPIVGFNRSPGVVAAVTNAGGFGVLGASAYTPAELDAQLTWIDEQTGGRPYGVDLLVPEKFATGDPGNVVASLRAQIPAGHLAFVADLLDRYGIPDMPGHPEHDEIAASLNPDGAAPLLDVAFRHPIALIANALGPPPPGLVDRARQRGVAVAALVGQPKHALRQIEAGVDLLIAQGTEAGGHTGTIATMVLTPEIVDIAAGRPVLAAGGIASGRQMAAALALGAAGVWCGSVWLSSQEDVANQAIKTKFLQATSSDTVRSPARTGKPARQLRSAWHEEWERPGSPAPLPLPLQPMLVNEAWHRIDAAARAGHEGALRLESFFVGQQRGDADLRVRGHLHHRALRPDPRTRPRPRPRPRPSPRPRPARLHRARRGQPGGPRLRAGRDDVPVPGRARAGRRAEPVRADRQRPAGPPRAEPPGVRGRHGRPVRAVHPGRGGQPARLRPGRAERGGLTVTGGLPFFGGAGNNYSTHAIAETVQRARRAPGSYGLVGANGGIMSKYSAGVYSTAPAAWTPDRSAELQAEINGWAAPEQARAADGPGTIETYTVTHRRDGTRTGVVVGRLDADGRRFLAKGDDPDLLGLLTEANEPIGQAVCVRSLGPGNRVTVSPRPGGRSPRPGRET